MALISPLLPRSILVSTTHFLARQTGPAQCQSLCSPVSSVPTTNCPTTTCCTTSYETSLFQCLACIGVAGNLTDFTPAQQQVDGLVSACASDGITLPSLTFSSAGVGVQTLQSASQTTTPATASNPVSSDSAAASASSSTVPLSVPATTTAPSAPTTSTSVLPPPSSAPAVPSPTPTIMNDAMKRGACGKVYIMLVAASLFGLLI